MQLLELNAVIFSPTALAGKVKRSVVSVCPFVHPSAFEPVNLRALFFECILVTQGAALGDASSSSPLPWKLVLYGDCCL